jgi:putative tricarboxylic transport membrane protein
MKKYHPIIIAIWIGLSLCLIVFSYKLGLGKLRSPGPGLMPFSIGGLLLLISLCLLMVDLFKKSAEDKPSEEQRKVNFKKVGMVAASLILYGLLLERLGFPVTTFLLLLFLFRIMGVRWLTALVASALTALITYGSFTYLGVRLPSGIFRLMGF